MLQHAPNALIRKIESLYKTCVSVNKDSLTKEVPRTKHAQLVIIHVKDVFHQPNVLLVIVLSLDKEIQMDCVLVLVDTLAMELINNANNAVMTV